MLITIFKLQNMSSRKPCIVHNTNVASIIFVSLHFIPNHGLGSTIPVVAQSLPIVVKNNATLSWRNSQDMPQTCLAS